MNPRKLWPALLTAVLAVAGLYAVSPLSPANAAATLTQVSSFGSNPGALRMYAYVPDGITAGRPLVVAMHGCTQSATDYYTNSGWRKYADLYKVTVVFPEQVSANNSSACFNWFTAADIARGQGETLSVKQMVDHALKTYGSDANRVYVTGLSAGGAMTAVMLATYPEVFAGGAVVAGLPYNCGAICMGMAQNKTPTQWGDLVRNAYRGYTGPRPRVSIWHGTSDSVVIPANATELRDQFTNVAGISQTASSTGTLPGNTSVQHYHDSTGKPAVSLYLVQGIGHGTPVAPGSAENQCGATGAYYLNSICSSYYIAQSWGLAGGGTAPSPSPSVTTSPAPSPSTSPSTPPTAQPCFTASNYAHTTAGRARQSGGQTYANGSNQAMGLWNTYTVHTLRQTGPNYYVLADGQC